MCMGTVVMNAARMPHASWHARPKPAADLPSSNHSSHLECLHIHMSEAQNLIKPPSCDTMKPPAQVFAWISCAHRPSCALRWPAS